MPLELYKRRHSTTCLAEIQARVAAGKMKQPDLKQYRGCSCAWWVQGTNDYGKAIPRQSTKAETWEAAHAFLRKLNQAEPATPPRPRITIDDAVDTYMKSVENGNRDNTASTYGYTIQSLAEFLAGRGLVFLDELLIADHLTALQNQWINDGLEYLTMRTYRTRISTFLRYAMTKEWIDKHPMLKMDKLKKRRLEKDDVDDEEGVTLPLDSEGDHNWQLIRSSVIPFLEKRRRSWSHKLICHPESFLALLELMYETGLRVSDATIFRPGRMISTRRGASYTTRQVKTGQPVTVFLEPWLADKLRALPRLAGDFVFYDEAPNRTQYIQSTIRRPLRELGEAIGVKELRPHRFRDSFAVNRLNAGVLLEHLSVLLGHSSIAITQKHYAPFVKSRAIAMEEMLYQTRKVISITEKAS